MFVSTLCLLFIITVMDKRICNAEQYKFKTKEKLILTHHVKSFSNIILKYAQHCNCQYFLTALRSAGLLTISKMLAKYSGH